FDKRAEIPCTTRGAALQPEPRFFGRSPLAPSPPDRARQTYHRPPRKDKRDRNQIQAWKPSAAQHRICWSAPPPQTEIPPPNRCESPLAGLRGLRSPTRG